MADFGGQFFTPGSDLQLHGTVSPINYGGLMVPLTFVQETFHQQRIYDSTAGWCYYVLDRVLETPLSAQTTPPHTNNLVAGTHQLLGTRSS